jgi:hypothetical protein
VLAVHGDSVLIQVCIEEKYQEFLAEHFVYNADATAAEPPQPPSLWLLPPYYEKTYFSGSDLVPRVLSDDATGLLCRGGDEFVVAELWAWSLSDDMPRVVVLHLFCSGEWKRYYFEIREDWDLPSVSFDTVVPVNDHLLCWVDVYRGVMLIDVFEEPPTLQYIRLPMDPYGANRSNRNVYVHHCWRQCAQVC